MIMLEKTLIKQKQVRTVYQGPIWYVLCGIGLLQLVSILKRSLLDSIRIKMKINVAPNEKADAKRVIYPNVSTIYKKSSNKSC